LPTTSIYPERSTLYMWYFCPPTVSILNAVHCTCDIIAHHPYLSWTQYTVHVILLPNNCIYPERSTLYMWYYCPPPVSILNAVHCTRDNIAHQLYLSWTQYTVHVILLPTNCIYPERSTLYMWYYCPTTVSILNAVHCTCDIIAHHPYLSWTQYTVHVILLPMKISCTFVLVLSKVDAQCLLWLFYLVFVDVISRNIFRYSLNYHHHHHHHHHRISHS
jgi:pterin-4a-carbinolamine dehydratase